MKSYISIIAYKLQKTIIVFFMFSATNVAVNAQYFAEWSLSVNYGDRKVSEGGVTVEDPSSFLIQVSPKVGRKLNDKISVGANPFYILQTDKYNSSEERVERKTQMWGFTVFGRYRLLGTEKLSVLVESRMNIGGGNTKEKRELKGLITNNPSSMTTFSIMASPLITYDLSNKFSIMAHCDFLGMGFETSTIKEKETGRKIKNNNTGFYTQNAIFSLAYLYVGFIYKFNN